MKLDVEECKRIFKSKNLGHVSSEEAVFYLNARIKIKPGYGAFLNSSLILDPRTFENGLAKTLQKLLNPVFIVFYSSYIPVSRQRTEPETLGHLKKNP